MRIGIIGLGSMSTAIVKGLINKGGVDPSYIIASARNREKLVANCAKLGIRDGSSCEVAAGSDIVVIGVIPEQVRAVCEECGEQLKGKLVVSIAYGISHSDYMSWLPEGCNVVCTVPNTPIEVGSGILVCSSEHSLDDSQMSAFKEVFGAISLIEFLPAHLLDLGGIVAGSTPAFMDMIIEALGDAAVLHGMPRDAAYRLVENMMLGSAAYAIETGLHPGVLKDGVCSPGGATIKGVASLEKDGVRGAMIKAIDTIMK